MNFAISMQSELLKTKRSASFWLSIIAAAFIPTLFTLAYIFNPESSQAFHQKPWDKHFLFGWNALNAFLFPMYIILMCALVPQIEYKNNSWKQVFAAPQSVGNIYFSKFLTIHIMIFFFFLNFNFFMILSGVLTSITYPKYAFLNDSIEWAQLLKLNLKTYISVLGISAIQYWVSLRFKNFIAPVGIGLALLVVSVMARAFSWKHVFKVPFAHPVLTLEYLTQKNRPFLENHELNSIGYFAVFILIGFIDMKLRKEKG